VVDLGLDDVRSTDAQAGWVDPTPRSARDIRPLQELWALAVDSGLIEVGRTTARAGALWQRWERGEDGDVLAVWGAVVDTVLGLGAECGLGLRYFEDVTEAVDALVWAAWPDLYAGDVRWSTGPRAPSWRLCRTPTG